jgi:enoyl-CoA hydratase/carnithine racemase
MSAIDDWEVPSYAGSFGAIDVRVNAGIVACALNRPDAANSRNQQMRDELRATYRAVAADDSVRVFILRATGEKFFCTGMDLKESAASTETIEERRIRLSTDRDIEMLAALPQPTIAAINGYALGGGLEMAMACDLRVAASHAALGLPEVDHGLVPAGGGTLRLPELVGRARALEMMLLGQRIDATRALEIGLVNRVVPIAELDDVTVAIAAEIAKRPAAATQAVKRLVRENAQRPRDVALDDELETLLTLIGSARKEH